MKANNARQYPDNTTTIMAVARGEVDVTFNNHFYVQGLLEEDGRTDFGARNHFLGGGDVGALVLVTGAGVLASSDDVELGHRFIEYLLSEPIQRYIASQTTNYPLGGGRPLPWETCRHWSRWSLLTWTWGA